MAIKQQYVLSQSNTAKSNHLHQLSFQHFVDITYISGTFVQAHKPAGIIDTVVHMQKMFGTNNHYIQDDQILYKHCTDPTVEAVFPHLHVESQLVVTHAKLKKEIRDYLKHVCCSCEQLHQRKSVTVSEHF